MNTYEQIFNQRGRSYHLAMEKYPAARNEEFNNIIEKLRLNEGGTILDIPAGGGYLKQFLRNVNYLGYDFSGEFESGHDGIKKCKESKIDLTDECVNEIVSLAALHHIVDRKAFYAEMHRILKRGGQLVIADVSAKSHIATFLNGFVDQWNSMGHQGNFICENDLNELTNSGFEVTITTKSYFWNFHNSHAAMDFFRLLFCLDLQPPKRDLKESLMSLGVISNDDRYSINWELSYLVCKK
ncbi:class I SAM-dependent methyltransferase [Ekhidna sp.]|uniref:class I SAM-dependent methyltransferase n=1 Tax=Ekhidna sp. TaxID=2608089 RepID=UPI003CCBB742